jgi:hypothetical protein
MTKKLLILYRCCENEVGKAPKRPSRPSFFNKLKSFDSLIKSVEDFETSSDTEVEFQVIHDGPTGPLYDHINENIGLINGIDKINVQSNLESYKECVGVAQNEEWDYLYMVEDDYLHTNNAIRLLMDGVRKFDCITGYFHTDRLTRYDDITKGREWVGATRTSHWVTNESTTCTYMISNLIKDQVLGAASKFLLQDRSMWRFLIESGVRLWVPTPGVSTHLENKLMTPFIDWEFV